jgi:hypothetical protein
MADGGVKDRPMTKDCGGPPSPPVREACVADDGGGGVL